MLGLCYGMQLLAHLSGGNVTRANRREYGRANVRVEGGRLFQGFGKGEETPVWMSHGDHVDAPPPGYRVTASSANSPIAAFEHTQRPLFGVQFHPEVAHTPRGGEILNNFLFEVCGCTPDWTPGHFVETRGRPHPGDWSAPTSGSSAASPAESTPRWPRCWCIAPWATG